MLKIVKRAKDKTKQELSKSEFFKKQIKTIQEERAIEMLSMGVVLNPITLTDKVYSIIKRGKNVF